MEISEKIKKVRELRNLTQEHVATQLGMTQAGYSKIENGQTDITYTKIKEIAKVLDVSPEDLIAFDSQKYFNSFNNVRGNNNGSVIINMSSDEIKKLYEDKIDLLNKLLFNTNKELSKYREHFGEL